MLNRLQILARPSSIPIITGHEVIISCLGTVMFSGDGIGGDREFPANNFPEKLRIQILGLLGLSVAD